MAGSASFGLYLSSAKTLVYQCSDLVRKGDVFSQAVMQGALLRVHSHAITGLASTEKL